jgi:hypothetical protein
MKKILIAVALISPVAALAVTMETLGANADRDFFSSTLSVRQQVQAVAQLDRASVPKTVLSKPVLRPLGPGETFGSELGRVNLAAQLDRNLALLKEAFGSRSLDVGLTADSGAKARFLSFTDKSGTVLGKIGSLSDLRGKGIDVRIDAATSYNFRVEVGSIFDDPVHKSILHMTPINGTHGPSHDMTTGALLDAMRAKSAIVTIDGDEYWFFYGRDALSDGSGFADTRSFLVTHEAGMSTKAWPLTEASLPVGVPTSVTFGDAQVVMTRTSGGELIVNAGN